MATNDWILIADRSRAEVLHVLPNGMHPLPTLASYVHAAGRLRPQERDSDVSGRVQHPGGARSTVEPHEDRWHVEARRFAKELAENLEHEHQQRRFDRLIVIAPAPFLGVLREAWSPVLRTCILTEWTEDLMSLTEPERQTRLAEMITTIQRAESGADSGR